MTAPTEPAAPQGQAPAAPQAPEGQAASGSPGAAQQAPEGTAPQGQPDPAAELRASLAAERTRARDLERQLTEAKQASMSEDDKKLAKARDEGKAEARREAGRQVAAAQFRELAQGKLADPGAALEVIDLGKFVDEAGEVNRTELGKLVDRLAAALPAGGQGKVPPGARGQTAEPDFLRSILHR